MRELNQEEFEKLKTLTSLSIEYTLIEPTETGLKKSILDATAPVREYLKAESMHDYSIQKTGVENKELKKAFLVYENKVVLSQASLYRPNTKKGDPRIWFKGLPTFSSPREIIVVIAFENGLYLLNLDRLDINRLIKGASNPVKELLQQISKESNAIAHELLDKLKAIYLLGFVPADVTADTGIGRTLETLLGIKINSSRQPDYKGIEIKTFRDKKANRKTLFAQVPDWEISKFKSSREILDNFGYFRDGKDRLNCTVSTKCINSQGLSLRVDEINALLFERSEKPKIRDFATWKMEKLHERLLEKHNETFWITAEPRIIEGKEFFSYNTVQHTRKPIISQFDLLLKQGSITVDHLIDRDSKGKVVESGPLFKIEPQSLNLLFPPSKIYDLSK